MTDLKMFLKYVIEMIVSYIKWFMKSLFACIENLIFDLSSVFISLVLTISSIYTFYLLISDKFINCDRSEPRRHDDRFCFFDDNSQKTYRGDMKTFISQDLYHWTPYILLTQAILFHIPKFVLNQLEGNKFQLALTSFDALDRKMTKEKRKAQMSHSYHEFIDRLIGRNHFSLNEIFCEFLTFGIIIFQIYLMKINLGTKFYEDVYSGNPFDMAFPKTLQCTHSEVGPNGTIVHKVDKCDIPINYFNESIYTALWISVNLLLGLTALVLVYRLISLIFYSTSNAFNRFEFGRVSCGKIERADMMVVATWGFRRWLTLRRLAGEMGAAQFNQLLDVLSREVVLDTM